MRHVRGAGIAVLLSAAAFNSCTCQKQIASPPVVPTLKERPGGFHAAELNKTPQTKVQIPTAPPAEPQELAAAPTPAGPEVPGVPEVPQDFPVPVFKDAAVAQVQSLANNAHNVIFRSTAPVAELYNYYQDTLTRDGWKVTQQFQRGAHAFMSFKKGDLVANVTVAEDPANPGQQILAVMYEEEQPLEFDEF